MANHKGASCQSPHELEKALAEALRAGKTKQAVELAKQLHKQEPTPAHRQLLRDAYRERARQMHQQRMSPDAITVLGNALALGEADPTWLAEVAEEMATYGAPARALTLLHDHPESPHHGRILNHLVDDAIRVGSAGRDLLPGEFQPLFDLVVGALADLAAGRDEAVRTALQQVGIRSPFLEWKLLARGLQAYYQKDDARAAENWQRLDASRLPAQLVAPLRFQVDPEYRQAQTPEVQARLQRQADRLAGETLVKPLRALQASLADPDRLPESLRLAGQLVPLLREQAPEQVGRMAQCLSWQLVQCGGPDDVERYRKIFGAPADDPGLDRLSALCAEADGGLEMAHLHWQRFEQGVAKDPAPWHGQADRARALVWCRMGENAADAPDSKDLTKLPPFLRDRIDRPQPLQPPAERCFERSLELAPDRREAHEALLRYYQSADRPEKAEWAARRMLTHCPGDVGALETLAELLLRRQAHAEAVARFEEAVRANPLEKRLRDKLCRAHLCQARAHAEARQYEQARASFQAALEGQDRIAPIYCKWAACEMRAKDPARAEELLKEAYASAPSRAAVSLHMASEAICLKLPRPVVKRFEDEFLAALGEPATAATAVELARAVASQRLANVPYRGQKTHEKKTLDYLEKSLQCPFTAEQAAVVGTALVTLQAGKLARRFLAQSRRRFPTEPLLIFLEAESYLAEGPDRCDPHRVLPLLNQSAQLAAQLPPTPQREELLKQLAERQEMLKAFTGLSGMIGQLMGAAFEDRDEDEPDGDEEEPFVDFASFFSAPNPPPTPRKKRR